MSAMKIALCFTALVLSTNAHAWGDLKAECASKNLNYSRGDFVRSYGVTSLDYDITVQFLNSGVTTHYTLQDQNRMLMFDVVRTAF